MFVMPLASSLHRRALRDAAFPQAFAQLLGSRYCGSAGTSASDLADETRVPAMDVVESDTGYTVTFELPGATKEQLKVSIEARRLQVSATPEAAASKSDGGRTLYRERCAPAYARTVVLPAEVDAGAAQARFDNGVLTLVLPKRVPSGATRIAVQ